MRQLINAKWVLFYAPVDSGLTGQFVVAPPVQGYTARLIANAYARE